MHVEFEVSWWSTKLWLRRKWRRTLIRLHLRKPYDGPPVMQVFGPIKLSKDRLHGKLYEMTPFGPITLTDNPYEVLYARPELGLLLDETPNDAPHFLRLLADLDEETIRREAPPQI